MTTNFKKLFFLLIYRIIAKNLPGTDSLMGGRIGKSVRYFCCKRIFKYCGKNVNIEKGANFGSGFNLEIGDNSGIGLYCTVPSDILIGKNVMMGPMVHIFGRYTHNIDRIDIPMCQQGMKLKNRTEIEDDVWIGRQVIINYERKIRKGTVIAAGSVVTKDFEEFSIIGGNPATFIKSRLDYK